MNDKTVVFDDKTVSIRLMDDDYIVNDCPQQPERVETLKKRNGVWCACMGVFPKRTPSVKEVALGAKSRHGNCAIVAWDGDWVIGILTFFPTEDLIERKADGWEQMVPHKDTGTLAVATCVLCSLDGHQYRRKGIGLAMAELAIEWAASHNFERIAAFDVPSGITNLSWGHPCRPPKPFWEKLGFKVVGKQESKRSWDEVKSGFQQEMAEVGTRKEDEWKLSVFPEYFQDVESSDFPFAEIDAHYSLIKELN